MLFLIILSVEWGKGREGCGRRTTHRHDFGLGQDAAVRFAASAMVTIEIDLEAVQQSVEVQEINSAVYSGEHDLFT
jgi:hypothetical protein